MRHIITGLCLLATAATATLAAFDGQYFVPGLFVAGGWLCLAVAVVKDKPRH